MIWKGGVREKIKRFVRTVFFMVAMVISLLVSSLPVLVAVMDIAVSCVVVSSFTCLRCYGFSEHLRRYGFRSSLTDIPLVCLIRSLIVTSVYSICTASALSYGPYLGIVTLTSVLSVLILALKTCIFSFSLQVEVDDAPSFSRQRLHLNKAWGMPVLFLSSAVFALGHVVVAYRTSCRARRKLMFHRDPEAVLSCKSVFSGFHKHPRSPTPAGRTPKSASEMKRKPLKTTREEEDLPIRVLADIDSLFITCRGLTLHYKLSMAGSPARSSSTVTFLKPNSSFSTPHISFGIGRDTRPPVSVSSKIQYPLHKSHSIQFNSSTLYAPLLDDFENSTFLAEDIPVLRLDIMSGEEKIVQAAPLIQHSDGAGQFGIVLVHGFGGGVFSWRHVMGVLAGEVGCSVAAFDRPGWGLTSRPRRNDWEKKELLNPYKLDAQVDLLLSFCSEVGFSSVLLVGHDDGGLLALMTAQRAQCSMTTANVSVEGVVLLTTSLSREVVPGFARVLMRTSLGKKHLVRPLLRTEITQVVNRRAWYDASKLTTEVLSLYKAPLCVEGWDDALHEIGKLSFETVLSPQNASALINAVGKVPVLVVAGAEDALVSFKSAEVLASKFVNSSLISISGCGHLPHEECPTALLEAIIPFITRLLHHRSDSQSQLGTLISSCT